MPDEIQPALTPEEWKGIADEIMIDAGRLIITLRDTPEKVMARANAMLPDDDPRKITRELWYALDQVVRGQWPTEKMREDASRVVGILAALLPPDE